MAITARDIDTYLTDLVEAMRSLDPTLDIQKGPLAVLLLADAMVGSESEAFTSYLASLYQLSDPSLIRDEDMFELALNFGKDPNIAKVSQVTVYFYRNTRPEAGTTYTANEGTIVSTDDGRFNFTVVTSAEMNGDLADSYFNSARGWYEVPAVCAAVAAGSDYDLPPETINSIQTVQEDFDGCLNFDYAIQGDDPPDKYQIRDIVWNALQGTNSSAAGQIETVITDVSPTGVDDYVMVPSTNFETFRRLGQTTAKLGYDVYCITDSVQQTIDRGTAAGGETFLPLDNKPVLSVEYVAVDGTTVPFSLTADTSLAWRGSPMANDQVQISMALQPGQVWEIRYLYYDIIYNVHTALQGRSKIFDSDTLVRLADSVDVYIDAQTTSFATADSGTVSDDIRSFTESYLRNPDNPSQAYQQFITSLDPYDYQRAVEATVDGVQDFRLTRFARLDSAVQAIEVITFDGMTEYPILSLDSVFG